MTTFWQVFLGVIAAWLVIRLVLGRLMDWATRSEAVKDRLKLEGAERIADAVWEQWDRRERERRRRECAGL